MNSQVTPEIGGQQMAVMNFPGVRLAVPLVEVHSLVSVFDLDESAANTSMLAQVEVGGQLLPAIGFDAELCTLSALPDDYRVCANLGSGNPMLGIICQSIDTLKQSIREQVLPECMLTKASFIKGLALNDGEVLLCTNLSALVEYISAADKLGDGFLSASLELS